jgi:hypothetical protein
MRIIKEEVYRYIYHLVNNIDEVMDVDSIKPIDDDGQSLMSVDESGKYHSRKTWTPDEDRRLLSLVHDSQGRNWKKIAHILGNKTGPQCSYRYNKLITDVSRSKWNRNEDIQLLELTEVYGHNWVLIANKMPGKTPEEAKQRFTLKLDPRLKRSRFDREEDELILKLHEKFGNKWNEISKHFPNRNSAMIKNRYYSYLKNKNKDSTTLNVTGGSETLSNYSFSMTPSVGNSNYVKPSYSNFNGRNTVSYNDNNLSNFKEKMLSEYNILELDNDINMRIGEPNFTSNYLNYDYGSKTNQNWSDDIYTDIWSTLPQDLIKLDGNSPKTKVLEPEDKFKEEYNNVFNFSIKKDSFGEDYTANHHDIRQEYMTTKGNDNDSLMKQYQLLESVFNKIYEVSSKTIIFEGKLRSLRFR